MNHDSAQITFDDNLDELIVAFDRSSESRTHPIGKLTAHLDNVPHLAISIFVFRDDKLLLQQRAHHKYHSGGLWANTVCSHPRWEESIADCGQRRLFEELGWTVPLEEFGEIDYKAQVGELFENEHVHCLLGRVDDNTDASGFNPEEVAATEWSTLPDTLARITQQPEVFTPWFRIYMDQHRSMIDAAMQG